MRKRYLIHPLLLLMLAAALCPACSAADAGGTLTPIAGDELGAVYEDVTTQYGGQLATAVTPEMVHSGDAAGWQYLWEEEAAPSVELKVYENGAYQNTVTVLPGGQSVSGTILFGASANSSGYIWATDLHDGRQMGSHRYTYETASPSEPRRLAAGTAALEPGGEIWLAALLYGTADDYKPTDIAALQESGLKDVPLAAILTATFEQTEET